MEASVLRMHSVVRTAKRRLTAKRMASGDAEQAYAAAQTRKKRKLLNPSTCSPPTL
jgi:hypothetical protein